MKTDECKHENWRPAGYPYKLNGQVYLRVQSMYEVKCLDCGNFINLLTRKVVNNKGLIIEADLANDQP